MKNEDSLNIVEIADKRTLFVVCDGMGGHSCGEVASKTICDVFSEYWQQHSEESDSEQKVLAAAKLASKTLDEKSGYYQMGTTLVMCSIEGNQATIAHAGDSRCYVIDIKGNVKYRTIDHIESSSISLPYINRAFFTRHPEDAVPEVKVVELQPCNAPKTWSRWRRNTVPSAKRKQVITILPLLLRWYSGVLSYHRKSCLSIIFGRHFSFWLIGNGYFRHSLSIYR